MTDIFALYTMIVAMRHLASTYRETCVDEWHYAFCDGENGPIAHGQIPALLQRGELRSDDLVWTERMEDWAPAGTVFDKPILEPPRRAKTCTKA